MTKKVALTFGSDPEFMIIDSQGRYRSAIDVVKGSKQNKVDLGGGHKMFYDNVLAEFNVRPGMSLPEVLDNFSELFYLASKYLRGYSLKPQASNTYPPRECEHDEARVFGCDPEFCAYELIQLNPPMCDPGNTFRSAGGHIHLGFTGEEYPLLAPIKDKDTEDEDRSQRDWGRIWVIRMMDLFVGIPSLLMDHDPTSAARRKLYGKAGTHRPQEAYGVEYRAMGNFWLQSPKLVALVYDLSAFVVQFVADQKHLKLWDDENTCSGYDVEKLRGAIDNSDKLEAKNIMEKVVKKHLPDNLYSRVFVMSEPKQYDFAREWANR